MHCREIASSLAQSTWSDFEFVIANHHMEFA
jgi:hypothetical protein